MSKVELDESPSGFVEVLRGADGKLREYIRHVDHWEIVDRIVQAIMDGYEGNGKVTEVINTKSQAEWLKGNK